MKTNTLRPAKSALRAMARYFRRDDRGIAAIEFAMIVPIMFVLFVGTVEMSQAITVDRRVTQIASSTADLVAREKTITTAQIANVFAIANVLMSPYDTSLLRITLVSIGAKATPAVPTAAKVCWSRSYQGGTHTYTKGDSYPLSNYGIIDAGGSVVVAEVEYNYTPLIFSYFIKTTTKLADRFYLKPRVSNMIQIDSDPICTP